MAHGNGTPHRTVRFINLNTQHYPVSGLREETPRIRCAACGNLFDLGIGMDVDPEIEMITGDHLEMCDGDVAKTLVAVDRWWKEYSNGAT